MAESKRSHGGTTENRSVSRQTSETKEPHEKIYEIRIGVFQLVVVVLVSVLLVIGLYTYAAAYSGIIPLQQQSYELNIVDAITQDLEGNPKSTFTIGDMVVVNVTLSYPPDYVTSPLTFLQISRVDEPSPSNLIASIGFVQARISQGEEISAASSWTIPQGAPLGTYTVKIFVWNNWLKEGWKPLAQSQTILFEVV